MTKLRYTELRENPKALLAHTGFNPEEFDALCEPFTNVWQHYTKHYTIEGKPRQRQSRGRKNEILPTPQDKLLFVLYYLKTNPLQEVLATSFGMYQPHASTWLALLLPLLEKALEKAGALPERQSERLRRVLGALGDQDRVLIDGTERPVTRSTDYETQKEHYSGKKKITR